MGVVSPSSNACEGCRSSTSIRHTAAQEFSSQCIRSIQYSGRFGCGMFEQGGLDWPTQTMGVRIHETAKPTRPAADSLHSGFNQLDLPEYTSEEQTREKILVAIREGSEVLRLCLSSFTWPSRVAFGSCFIYLARATHGFYHCSECLLSNMRGSSALPLAVRVNDIGQPGHRHSRADIPSDQGGFIDI